MLSGNVSRRQFTIGVVSAGSTIVAGCLDDDSSNERDDRDADDGHDRDRDDGYDDDGIGGISNLRIIDRDDDEAVADYHGHWHGGIPSIPLGERVSLGAVFHARNGDELRLGDDAAYQFGVRVSEGADKDVVSIDLHGDRVHLWGESEGETAVVFQLLRGEDVEWETMETIGVEVLEG